ncbi:hypothetical protein L6164_014313 [Bauhinia variegata]|uniref:Uncharacterized protein n=1 Tax=Bauhinia variegata TaxID=167791 RepID=A0ACB9NIW3_BAUVA|nr:hypothetical protein L6164_014313 [Bauhinia variegata]
MELQLGLALPSNPIPTKPALDLNSNAYDAMNLLGYFPWNHTSNSTITNKRSFSQVFNFEHNNTEALFPTTLSLLPSTPCHPNDDDDRQSNCSTTTKNDGDDVEEAVVGWPPVNSRRKKLRQDNSGVQVAGSDRTTMINICGFENLGGSNNALYVKVKMDGVGIARKIDLGLHRSFESLKETLLDMFGKCYQEYSDSYKLAYQDKEGDWLLAEDVSWRSFVGCVQRLKLMKTSG